MEEEINNNEEQISLAKLYRDKHVLEVVGGTEKVNKATATRTMLGVSPENYDSIEKERINKDIKMQFLELIKDDKLGEATELLVDWIKEKNHLYTTKDDERTEMWIYKEGIYVPQGKSEVKEQLRNLLGKWYNIYYNNQVMAKLEPDTFIERETFFSKSYKEEIPIKNGLLNIVTRELNPFTHTKIFFNKLPVYYESNAQCPEIEKFLGDVLSCEDDKLVFYEMGGFCLWKEYKFEKAFMLVGDGRNGKDKSLELIKRLIGIENCCSVPLTSLIPDSFIISEFFGRMVNIAGEINNQDLKDTSMFKALTGRSLLSAPRKFLRAITFQNSAKFIFACNQLPMVYDSSKGFWDRWILLEYPYTFVSSDEYEKSSDKKNLKIRDEDIIEKITTPSEMSGMLNKFLDGLDRLMKKRTFSCTKGSVDVKNLWVRKANSFTAFALDKIEGYYDTYLPKKELRKRYMEYCKEHKVNPKSDYVIKRTLQEEYGCIDERKEVFANNWEFVWMGVRWK